MLRETFTAELKKAMLAQDKLRLSTVRLIIAALKERDIEARGRGNMDGISDADILSMMQGMIKQRKDSIVLYEQGGRIDLVEKEQGEIAIIRGYMPEQMDGEAMQKAVAGVIRDTGAASLKDMGKVMAGLRAKYAGSMDFSTAGAIVKQMLSPAGDRLG